MNYKIILYHLENDNHSIYLCEINISRVPCIGEHVCFTDANGNDKIAPVLKVFHAAEDNCVFVTQPYAVETFWRKEGMTFGDR